MRPIGFCYVDMTERNRLQKKLNYFKPRGLTNQGKCFKRQMDGRELDNSTSRQAA
jgi:hypothetical protein